MYFTEASAPQANGLLLLSSLDFLKDGAPWYARRAGRKKIALIKLDAKNTSTSPITVDFARARLSLGEKSYEAEKRDTIIGKLSTFQWEFLFYWILHFSVIELAIELLLFFAGTLFNKSLRNRLSSILDQQVILQSGERLQGLVAFRKVASVSAAKLEIPWSVDGTHFEWVSRNLDDSV
ncbi:MAG: hypothetical protein HY717_07680 [Planctomycetes bacterium]|nr:hypothetical protein [Planctomycetota bacterium]